MTTALLMNLNQAGTHNLGHGKLYVDTTRILVMSNITDECRNEDGSFLLVLRRSSGPSALALEVSRPRGIATLFLLSRRRVCSGGPLRGVQWGGLACTHLVFIASSSANAVTFRKRKFG